MATTLVEFISDLRTIHQPESTSTLTDSWYVRRLNEALNKIATDFEVPQLEETYNFTLVAGQRFYSWNAISPMVLYPISVCNNDTSRILEAITPFEADNFSNTYQSEPGFFLTFNLGLELYPLVDSGSAGNTMQVRYMAQPTQFDATAQSATSPLPQWLDRVLLSLAAAFVFGDVSEPDRAAASYAQYRALMGDNKEIHSREFARQRSFTRPTRTW